VSANKSLTHKFSFQGIGKSLFSNSNDNLEDSLNKDILKLSAKKAKLAINTPAKIDFNNNTLYNFPMENRYLSYNLKRFTFALLHSDLEPVSKNTIAKVFKENPNLYCWSKGINYKYMWMMDSNFQSQVLLANFKSYFDNGNPDLKMEAVRNIVNKYQIITSYLSRKPQLLELYYMYNNTIEGLLNKNYFNFSPVHDTQDLEGLNKKQSKLVLTWENGKDTYVQTIHNSQGELKFLYDCGNFLKLYKKENFTTEEIQILYSSWTGKLIHENLISSRVSLVHVNKDIRDTDFGRIFQSLGIDVWKVYELFKANNYFEPSQIYSSVISVKNTVNTVINNTSLSKEMSPSQLTKVKSMKNLVQHFWTKK